jgi:hypothetical protein
MKNRFYEDLLETDKIRFKILFEEKSSWYANNADGTINYKIRTIDDTSFNKYELALKDFINLQSNEEQYNLNNIHFADFNASNFFGDNKINKNIWFEYSIFNGKARFRSVEFTCKAKFSNGMFYDVVRFNYATFHKEVMFDNVTFNDEARFIGTKFKELFILYKSKCYNLNLENSKFEYVNLLNVKGLNDNQNEIIINKSNFANKETARLFKAHFEKTGNITEATKYFVIEQEKYIDYLRANKQTENGKWNKLIPLYLNKFVSNFGTDWVRSLLTLFLWGFVVMFGYMSSGYSLFTYPHQSYISDVWHTSNTLNTFIIFSIVLLGYIINLNIDKILNYKVSEKFQKYHKVIKYTLALIITITIICFYDSNLFNHISKLINPINAFKDDDIFKGYEAFGVLARVVSTAIIYQTILAFRQFTRRA